MPNHVTSRLTFSGPQEQIDALKARIMTATSEFDFNTILPMPTELIGTTSPPRKNDDETDETFNQRMSYLRNKHGATDWYDWSCSNWGTKWNAYDVSWSENEVRFDTAWSFPEPVIAELSRLYPELSIAFIYADEDTSSNTGTGLYEAGEQIEGDFPDGGSRQGYENYFELNPEEREQYQLIEGNYEYVEEEDDE